MEKQEKLALVEKAYQIAYDYDLKFGCCPQCVLAAVQETIGGIDDAVIKASHALAGGGGLAGAGTCGALSGGMLALGAYHGRGRTSEGFESGRSFKSFQYSKELFDTFSERNKGFSCNDVQCKLTGRSWDFWNLEESTSFKSQAKDECAKLTGEVASFVVKRLLNV
jgi:C_GCAxxG_C_C family probable redox protein